MSIQVVSATNTTEQVQAALGNKVEDKSVDSKVSVSAATQQDENTEDSEPSDENENSTEDQEVESNEQEGDGVKPVESSKKKNGIQKRIGKLTSKLSAKEQEVEYWKAEALKAKAPTQQNPEYKVEVKQEGKPNPNDFEKNEDYLEALSDWKVDQRLKSEKNLERVNQLKSEAHSQKEKFAKKSQELSAKVEDFEDVIESVDDIPLSMAVQEILLSSDNGPELMYELAKDRETYQKICAMNPIQAARAIGAFESKLNKPSEQKPEVKTTNAPKPISTVKSGSSKAGSKSIYDRDISQHEYEKLRREQMKEANSF